MDMIMEGKWDSIFLLLLRRFEKLVNVDLAQLIH